MTTKSPLFAVAAIAVAGAGLVFQAQDAHYSHTQANAVVQADQTSSSTSSVAPPAVADLRTFVSTHMGSSVSFTLTGSYTRAQSASQAAAATQVSNANVYAAAQAACSGKTDSLVQARCNAAYLQSHLPSSTPMTVAAPKLSDYQYNLKAPFWTPDLAGALLLGSLFAFVLLLISLLKPRRRMF